MRKSTPKITHNTLKSEKVRFTMVMYIDTYLLNNTSNIMHGEDQILQNTGQPMVESVLRDQSTLK